MQEPRTLSYLNKATLSLDNSRQFFLLREGWVHLVQETLHLYVGS